MTLRALFPRDRYDPAQFVRGLEAGDACVEDGALLVYMDIPGEDILFSIAPSAMAATPTPMPRLWERAREACRWVRVLDNEFQLGCERSARDQSHHDSRGFRFDLETITLENESDICLRYFGIEFSGELTPRFVLMPDGTRRMAHKDGGVLPGVIERPPE